MLMCCAKFCSNCGYKQKITYENLSVQNADIDNKQHPEVRISLGILNEQLQHTDNKYNFENISSLGDIYKVISHNFGSTDFSKLYLHDETKNDMIKIIKHHINGKITMREFFYLTLRLNDSKTDYICNPKTINLGFDLHYSVMQRRFKKLFYICNNIDKILSKIMQLKQK
jgi:hypothetical protein